MPVSNRVGPDSRRWPNETTSQVSSSTDMLYRLKDGWKSLPGEDRTQVLAYDMKEGYGTVVRNPAKPTSGGPWHCTISDVSEPWRISSWAGNAPGWCKAAHNKAYEKFKERATGESAQLGVAVLEARESYGMIANRAIQLRRAWKAARKGDIHGFLKEIGVTSPKRKHRTPSYRQQLKDRTHDASALWLEYWFGWSAMIGDIGSAMGALERDIPLTRFSGKGIARQVFTKSGISGSTRYSYTCNSTATYRTGATVICKSPNLYLANQLGLINPASVAWEAVPFSFVVDWFTGAGNVIDSYSDFVGCTLSNRWSTYHYKESNVRTYGGVSQYNNGLATTTSARMVHMIRKKELIRPLLLPPQWLNVASSKTRAASAVSLLTQALRLKN